jgi:hypothetical protein
VIDPIRKARTWEYTGEYFYSLSGGAVQPLPNGDFLITSSRGGRVFEVDARGTIVWQFEPPYLPMREARYPLDFCPQLAGLPRTAERKVEAKGAPAYVSRDLYDFLDEEEFGKRRINGVDHSVLTPQMDGRGLTYRIDESGVHEYCKDVVVPGEAELSLRYLLDPPPGEASPGGPVKVEFLAWFEEERGRRSELSREIVDSAEPAARAPSQRVVDLGALALRRGRLCVGAKAVSSRDEARLESMAIWFPPRIERKWFKAFNYKALFKKVDLTKHVLDPIEQQRLRAMGYLE